MRQSRFGDCEPSESGCARPYPPTAPTSTKLHHTMHHTVTRIHYQITSVQEQYLHWPRSQPGVGSRKERRSRRGRSAVAIRPAGRSVDRAAMWGSVSEEGACLVFSNRFVPHARTGTAGARQRTNALRRASRAFARTSEPCVRMDPNSTRDYENGGFWL